MEELLIAVNVGNTTTNFGLAIGGRLVATLETTTVLSQTADEALMSLNGFLISAGNMQATPWGSGPVEPSVTTHGKPEDDGQVMRGILASVVPSLSDVWFRALDRICTGRPLEVGPGLRTGLKMTYHDPSELGADRVAEIAAASEIFGAPTLVVSLGTSTTLDLLDDQGRFAGGIITPGMRLSASALSSQAARLPVVECKAPKAVVGKRTRDAMQSGIVLGEAARIDGLVDMVWDEIGYQTQLVLTGSDAKTIQPLLRHEAIVEKHLALKGLVSLYELNTKKR